jgi:hypothetical protein
MSRNLNHLWIRTTHEVFIVQSGYVFLCALCLSAVLSAVSSAVGIAKVEALAKEEDVFAKADQPVTMSIADRNVCATFPVAKSENKFNKARWSDSGNHSPNAESEAGQAYSLRAIRNKRIRFA